jgi:hypothetical protein
MGNSSCPKLLSQPYSLMATSVIVLTLICGMPLQFHLLSNTCLLAHSPSRTFCCVKCLCACEHSWFGYASLYIASAAYCQLVYTAQHSEWILCCASVTGFLILMRFGPTRVEVHACSSLHFLRTTSHLQHTLILGFPCSTSRPMMLDPSFGVCYLVTATACVLIAGCSVIL